MPDYRSMYLSLFRDVTDAIERLQAAQQKTEELYLACDTDTAKVSAIDKTGGNG